MPRSVSSIVALFSFVIGYSLQANEIAKRLDLPDRLTETREGLTVEYEIGQEELADAVFNELHKWRQENAAIQNERFLRRNFTHPFSFQDMKMNRDEILMKVANAIGLPEPTLFQEKTYDTFLGYYELAEEQYLESARKLNLQLKQLDHVMIWEENRLQKHLKSGKQVQGFGYNRHTGSITFNWPFLKEAQNGERFERIREKIESYRLDHTFKMDSDEIRATVSTRTPSLKRLDDHPRKGNLASGPSPQEKFQYPLLLSERSMRQSPQKTAQSFIDKLIWLSPYLINEVFPKHNPYLAFVILHETAESGLVDQYIASPGRRWICDGTANFVAWKIAKERSDTIHQEDLFDFQRQLIRHKEHQARIDLTAWSATENEDGEAIDIPLNRAHYAFAARAVFTFAEEHGENAVAELWKTIGRTSKRKTSMRTVAKAYHRITGKKLDELIRKAESDPITTAKAERVSNP